jgi:hypothetical protein
LLDCWIAGLLDCWIAGLLDCWIAGFKNKILGQSGKRQKYRIMLPVVGGR